MLPLSSTPRPPQAGGSPRHGLPPVASRAKDRFEYGRTPVPGQPGEPPGLRLDHAGTHHRGGRLPGHLIGLIHLQAALTERLRRYVKHGRRQVADELQRQQDAAAMRTAAVEGITAKSGAPTTTAVSYTH